MQTKRRIDISRPAMLESADFICRFHLLVGEDAMSWHTLFQSGMGALDAPRTEERFLMGALVAQSGYHAASPSGSLTPVKAPRLPALFPLKHRDRGNSAKALSHRRARTAIP